MVNLRIGKIMTNFSMLHTMIRVLDLEKSINFYTKYLAMKVLRRTDYPDGKFTLVFIGYGDEASNTVLGIISSNNTD